MEIGPIPGIRVLPGVKPPKNAPQLSAVFEVENAIGPQQDTFSHNESKMSGGQDDAIEEEASAELSAETPASDSSSIVNLFA